jgi:hypothetical protein
MPNIVTKKFKIHNAEQFIESLSEISATNLYFFIGKNTKWNDDDSVLPPTDSFINTNYKYWDDLIAAKKVSPTDVKHVIRRVDWYPNNPYTAYHHNDPDIYDKDFYVLTEEMNVYKCLQNNLSNGFSTVMPTGTGIEILELSDGYKWKFLYKIGSRDSLKFLTNDSIPVQKVGLSNIESLQSLVEDAATSGAIDIINKKSNGDFIVSLATSPKNASGEDQDYLIGETLVGLSSQYTATLTTFESLSTKLTCGFSSEKFILGETIVGQTSGARSIVNSEPLSTYKFNEGILTSVSNSSVMVLSPSANTSEDNIYVGSTIYIQNNAGQGESSKIISYESAGRRITIDPAFSITPNTSSGYIISPSISISGDGTGSTGRTIGNTTHGITDIRTSQKGQNYTFATIDVQANPLHGSGATAEAVIGPIGGHGKNAIEELGGNFVIVDVVLKGNEVGYFTTSNDYRQIGLLRDPLKNDGSNTFFTSTLADQSLKITMNRTTGLFETDEQIYQGDSLETSTANGYVVDFIGKKLMRINKVFGTFDENLPIRGSKTGATGYILPDSIKERDIKPYSGDILYIENREKIQRLTDQVEDFKILLEF